MADMYVIRCLICFEVLHDRMDRKGRKNLSKDNKFLSFFLFFSS